MSKQHIKIFTIMAVWLLCSAVVVAQPYIGVKNWHFAGSAIGDWMAGNATASVSLSKDIAVTDSQSIKAVKGSGREINIQNDIYKNIESNDSIYLQLYVPSTLIDSVEGFQIFWQEGSSWSWKNIWINKSDITPDQWTTIARQFPSDVAAKADIKRLGFQLRLTEGSTDIVDSIYIDDVTIKRAGPVKVSEWGLTPTRTSPWRLTSIGEGSVTFGQPNPPNDTLKGGVWAAMRGEIHAVATESYAVIVRGKMKWVGGNGFDAWNQLRFGIFNVNSPGTLVNAGQPTASWTNFAEAATGYMICPRSGANDHVSWAVGGNGTQGVIRGGAWLSSFGASHWSLGMVNQKPMRAKGTPGVYNFAISVKVNTDGSKEFRYFYIKEDNSYWIGGVFTDTTTNVPPIFNSINIAIRGDGTNPLLEKVEVTDLTVEYGSPITIPEAPWQKIYVENWGMYTRELRGNWRFIPDPLEIIGNAGMGGSSIPEGSWASILGNIPESIELVPGKVYKLTGVVKLTGNAHAPGALRFGVFNSEGIGKLVDSADVLTGNWKDSTVWNGSANNNTGYLFVPPSGSYSSASWIGLPGGLGSVGGVYKTYSHITSPPEPDTLNNYVIANVRQAPLGAKLLAGTYDYAITLEMLSDGNTEVKYYFIKKNTANPSILDYWFGGSFVDTAMSRKITKFNSIIFSVSPEAAPQYTLTQLTLEDVAIDTGHITIPAAPVEPAKVTEWGYFYRGPAPNWKQVVSSTPGNVGLVGTAAPNGPWTVLRGKLPDVVSLSENQTIVVSGKMEFVGAGPETWSALRYGLYRHDNEGTYINAGTDSARWVDGSENGYGYLITPRSGTNNHVSWAVGGNGTAGVVRGGVWLSSFGASHASLGVVNQKPARAVAGAGVYDFAISVTRKAGYNEVRYYFVKDSTYWVGAITQDTFQITTEFNGVIFGLNGGNGAESGNLRGLNLINISVNIGDPIALPEYPPFKYYVADWGIVGNRYGGWFFETAELIGDAGIVGISSNSSTAVI